MLVLAAARERDYEPRLIAALDFAGFIGGGNLVSR